MSRAVLINKLVKILKDNIPYILEEQEYRKLAARIIVMMDSSNEAQ